MREELGSRNVSNKTVDMHSLQRLVYISIKKTILLHGLYLVRKLRSNPFQHTLFHLETISLCGDIHQILRKWEACQQFCKSLYMTLEYEVASLMADQELMSELWSTIHMHFDGQGLPAMATIATNSGITRFSQTKT